MRDRKTKKIHLDSKKEDQLQSFDDFYILLDSEGAIFEIHETPELRKLFKWSQKCIGQPFKECPFHPDFMPVIELGIEHVMTQGEAYKTSFCVKGSYWFSATFMRRNGVDGENGFIVFGRDITTEKKSEEDLKRHVLELENIKKAMFNLLEDMDLEKKASQALAKDLEKFKKAVDASSDHIQITDSNGVNIYLNSAVEQITGYTPAESLGKKGSELWEGQINEVFYNNFWNTAKSKRKAFSGELKNRKKSGEEYISDTQIYPILNDLGDPVFFVGIERDITHIKEVDRMKSEFVSVASHQLRAPLSAIKWLTEILLDSTTGPITIDQKDLLSQIDESNERMIRLVNDLLDISHIETGNKFNIVKTSTDMVHLVDAVLKEQKVTAEKKSIEFTFLKKLPKVLMIDMDGDKVIQVIQNFVSNAIKYSEPKTKIIIDLFADKDELQFMVRNFGTVIKLEDQKNIFQKFYRTDEAKLMDSFGSGLGLYIAKAIIENHGGKMWFTSLEKEGTSFYFSLPCKKNSSKKI